MTGSAKHYLGRLCQKKHDWSSSGQSLRYVSNHGCVSCVRDDAARWMQQNPAAAKVIYTKSRVARKEAERQGHRLRKYGVTPSAYNVLVSKQDGRCAVCGSRPKSLCVDHDHKTGRVRGLLCHRCNQGIGLFLDDTSLLGQAVVYLQAVSQ